MDGIVEVLKQIGYKNIKVKDVQNKLNYTNTLIIAEAKNTEENRMLYEAFLQANLQQKLVVPQHIEGVKRCEWIIVDCDKTVIHLFAKEVRERYNFDKLHK